MAAHNPAIIQVILGLPTRNKDIVGRARTIITGLTGNTRFPSPTPSLAVLTSDVNVFDQAETVAGSRAPGAVQHRDAAKAVVLLDLSHVRDYVQGVVDAAPADAASAVVAAGLKVGKPRAASKPPLAVKDAPTSGSVVLVAKAVARVATYQWESSLDGKTWTSLPVTLKSTTIVAGLTVGQTYSFRFVPVTRTGAGEASQAVTHVVR
jgi:hypothetical protein